MGIEDKKLAQDWLNRAAMNLQLHDQARSDEDKAANRELAQIEVNIALTNAMLYLADKLER